MIDEEFVNKVNATVAKNLSYYLEIKKITQTDLAKRMNVSDATTSNWCKGIKLPRMDKIDKICHILEISRADLIEEHDLLSTKPTNLTALEADILMTVRSLNEIGQEKVRDYADDLTEMGKYRK